MPPPLKAYYKGGQYVLVYDKQAQEELRLLGCFGTNLEDAKRKETKRAGPSDRQLVDYLKLEVNHIPTTDHKQTTALTLHEAFFLTYSFGYLSIEQPSSVENDEQQQQLDLRECWNVFRQYHKNSNIPIDFALEYGVYHYFRTRHWVVKVGTNYGANFILYKNGPSQGHSQYAVIIVDETNTATSGYNWTSFMTFHRVCQSVGKELLLTFVSLEKDTDLGVPHCVRKMKIVTRIFSVQASTIGRQNSETTQEQSTNKVQ